MIHKILVYLYFEHYLNYHLFSNPNNIIYLISFLCNFSISFFSPCFFFLIIKKYNHDYNDNNVVVLVSPAAEKKLYTLYMHKKCYLLPLYYYIMITIIYLIEKNCKLCKKNCNMTNIIMEKYKLIV